jgi:putative Mn2+ efflux pump MntP
MIWDACLHQSGKEGLDGSFSFPVLAVLAIATSMDALVAGFTLPSTVGMRLFPSVAVIGIVTAALCTGGVKVGFLFGDRVGRPAKILGGLILLLLSCKIFMEQMR